MSDEELNPHFGDPALQEQAETIRRERLESAGLADQYDMWRESMADTRMPEHEVYETFLKAQDVENGAIEGRVSVSTGGEEITAGTDIPTPGPDDAGDGPDETGDTSEGGSEDTTDLKLVEGMWQPPEESTAENYEEPTTDKMSKSKDWIDNARTLHEFMGSPKQQPISKTMSGGVYFPQAVPQPRDMSDEEIGHWARNQLSMFNWNVMATMNYAQKIMNADDPETALAFLNLINMYDHSDGGAVEFSKALASIASDPTTYLGLGVGSVVAKGAAKVTAKAGLKKATQMMLVGGSAGGVEGGMLAGGYDLTVQNVEQEAGARKDINKSRAALSTGAGVGLGSLLGGGTGRWAGHRMDRWMKAVEEEFARVSGSADVLASREGSELGEAELMEMLLTSSRAGEGEEALGRRDEAAQIAQAILGEDGKIPRLEDGSMDFKKIYATIEEVKAQGKEPVSDNVVPFKAKIADEESQALVQKIIELDELEKGDVVLRGDQRPGSRVVDELGKEFEVVGRTKNGWYRLRDNLGREHSLRRKQFDVIDKAPAPRKAGPMELDPFSKSAAKVMAMNEQVVSGKLQEVKITHAEQAAIVEELRDMGIDITQKNLASYWTPAELMFLRDTYNAQANGIADLARSLESQLRNEGRLLDSDLARFNNAHSQFVATRDLFFGTSGNAARQLNILRSKPAEGVYEFSQMLMDSISLQGGRSNTERAIKLMADFSRKAGDDKSNAVRGVSKMSDSIWGNKHAAWLLNVRYNMMLSSWRTHAFNFMGNSASGIYQHLMVSPVKMGINNTAYARDLAWSKISGEAPDPADRLTRHQWYAELRGHYSGFRESLSLAKEIALGRDVGEGKVWNELGLRYNVVNVPDGWFGKLGTTPVRALEAGDAFFKNQYYNSKIHEMASVKARTEEVHQGMDYETRYAFWMDNANGAMQRSAKEFAQKQTYTNDPNIYGGVLAALAKGVSTAQNKNLMVNMLIPFVRTPANLLSYSMEMIGANTVLSPGKTYNSIMHGSAQESQEALARLTVAVGLWVAVAEMYQNGDITGTGPSNFEERKVWEAAGWQPNSIKVHGKWIDISRADPGGQSLATIASVYDYYAMTRQQDKPAMEWIGAGLLYTSDMIIDESYLSTVSDMITAIQSKETGRAQSVTASMINSLVVPNLMRDVRRPADVTMRSGSSVNLLDAMQKQMMNASPWHSEDLAPQRDWKGDIKNYYGNVYERAILPFNVRDPANQDTASAALSYARIPVSTPDKQISWPGGLGDAIDLFAMDNGDGFVYDKYLETVGNRRSEAVNVLLNTPEWDQLVKDENVGPGSEGETLLRKALGIGSKAGRLEMLSFLIDHSGKNNTYTRGDGNTYLIKHQVSVDEYIRLRGMVRNERTELPEDSEQYRIRKRTEGPEFFKP